MRYSGMIAAIGIAAVSASAQVPAGTPRPVPPAANAPADFGPDSCATPAGQARVRRALTDTPDSPNGPLGVLKQRADYRERLVEWKRARLQASGKVPEAKLAEIMLGGLKDGSTGGDPMANFKLIEEMMSILEEGERRDKAGDAAGACAAGVKLFALVERVDVAAGRQWAGIEAALDAEAKRAGVSFD